ncbi:MAG: CHAT domain-containing protein [Sphingomonadaceae bacterium]|nr:CHAT domain-containing protein [Sphingomonadaceae bacterium]
MWTNPLLAQAYRPSLMDSFPIGTGGALCQAQNRSTDPAIEGIFDRAWTIVCRDAAKPVGQVFALRGDLGATEARVARSRDTEVTCDSWRSVEVSGLANAERASCRDGYSLYRFQDGKVTYYAQGLSAYDNALELGLRTIAADRLIPEKLEIAITGGGDAAAFARAQAETLDPTVALAEGYRRNNSGNFVEAAQFFDSLQQQAQAGTTPAARETETQRLQRLHEYGVNRALQLSNLAEFEQADTLFLQAAQIPVTDRVQVRLRRNFEAMHLLNQQRLGDALAVLDRPILDREAEKLTDTGSVIISEQTAAEVNGSNASLASLGVRQETALTADERAAIIDAQALQLRGTIQRLQGNAEAGSPSMSRALEDAMKIRNGRVVSIARLRAQIMTEMALAEEERGNFGNARLLLDNALALLKTTYPETSAVNNVRARLAAYLVRRGSEDEALGLYRTVISSANENGIGVTGLTNQLQPYFDLLARRIASTPSLVDDLFMASQSLIRPGAADSMEILSRELLAGDGEAASLFRQSITLSRDIERARIELARLTQIAQQDSAAAPLLATQQANLAALAQQQTATQAALSAFPQFRAISKQALTLNDLRAAMKPGEAYYKLAVAGTAVYAIYADAAGATGYRLPLSAADLGRKVDDLRSTISVWENGAPVTYAFDVALGRQLFLDLFAPVDAQLKKASHLIFEPDGAMLKLPVNLLIADQAGVDAYLARPKTSDADEFDFRGIAWLGRTTAVSTSISARSFRDSRAAPASGAERQYLGFGKNAPAFAQLIKSPVRGASTFDSVDCTWPLSQWNRPIADTELRIASDLIGGANSKVVTEREFTDRAIIEQTDLNDYRILHFATHGFVTAPRVGCPARPALLTSIGAVDSDGLLSFGEIFDLKIDADVVILSACDTAGQASAFATREAGLGSGGGSALDGLVRAFIGAGGRSVVASHWPAPDQFEATERLISGLFRSRGVSVTEAMRSAQIALMDDPNTSHPFYWSGFAIVGDGARLLLAGS